jgi:hypothetical protein
LQEQTIKGASNVMQFFDSEGSGAEQSKKAQFQDIPNWRG